MEELKRQTEKYLAGHPEIKKILKIFNISLEAYEMMLSSLTIKKTTKGLANTSDIEWSSSNGGISRTY
ncbi:MAG: hypothetical protein A2W23_05005 [Planctomycetes bacterium RBG_16_43_13]|nr:MAG: hypothetical protein A2W23_05005 [Planctomycetes bacterium RBG_16_43_13]